MNSNITYKPPTPRSIAWRTAGIGLGLIVVYVSAFAQGLHACRDGWPF